ncbi:MAG: OadG family protein [Woeseiaceae bacterium]
MEDTLFSQGVTLMLAGMGTVFTFLTTLVIAMTLMSRTLMRLQGSSGKSDVSDEEIAAISAAIAQHRSTNTKQNK